MRVGIALAAMLCALGCSRDEPSTTTAATAVPADTAAARTDLENSPDWNAERALGPRGGVTPFDASVTTPTRRVTTPAVQPSAEPVRLPPPFAYVGKVVRGRSLYAVLARDDRVFLVGGNDTLDAYRVQSVTENEVLLVASETGDTFALPFSPTSGTSAAPPLSAVPGTEDASLQISAPSRVSVGEQFTLTVSLDSGTNVVLETGRVEVRYDPKVLQVAGETAASGAVRLEIAGAYAGHPMPATVQFRVVARGPTATEIQVVPTNIADTEGRDVGINPPRPHKLMIVQGAAPGG